VIVGSREVQPSVAQQPPDDRQGLLEAGNEVVRRVTHGAVLKHRVAGTQAEYQPSTTDLVQGIGHLRQQRGIAKPGAGNEDPKLDAASRHGQGSQQGPPFPHAEGRHGGDLRRDGSTDPFVELTEDAPRVVGEPERVEADFLCLLGQTEEIGPAGRDSVYPTFPVRHVQTNLERSYRGSDHRRLRCLICFRAL